MRLELHNALQSPQRLEATRLVIYDNNGTPLAAVVEHGRGSYIIETIDNPAQLHGLLRAMGIDKTVIVHEATTQPLSEVIWTPP